jgi:hypothetical protein
MANSFFNSCYHFLSCFTKWGGRSIFPFCFSDFKKVGRPFSARDSKNTVFSTQKYSLHPIALCGLMLFKFRWCMIMHLRMWFPLSPEPDIKAETQRAITPPFPPWVPRHITQGGLHWCLLRFLCLIKGFESATLVIAGRDMRVFLRVVSYFEDRETFL